MTDRSKFEAEDFLIDNTFQLYCSGADQLCTDYWKKYIAAHPEQHQIIDEAKRLFQLLSGHKKQLDKQTEVLQASLSTAPAPIKRFGLNWFTAAAAIIVISGLSFLFLYHSNRKESAQMAILHFRTQAGERKKVFLPDGSTVFLNAKSSLSLSKDFNGKYREVSLNGEAFFDVKHDKERPFSVRTADFNINVLGTAFNVKAYADEFRSEATLIRGLITMQATNGDGGVITLKPSQKVTFHKILPPQIKPRIDKPSKAKPEILINHYTMVKDSTIVETAWTQNRIEIYDQDFEEVRQILEKWLNVKIKFVNPELASYHFTATFGNENIKQVLEALQKVENFKYEIKNNQINISK